tara:strand:+ start:315 stop:1040 length:726 start_codon:yes stop_codon:yes gene_type:complete
MKKYLAEGLVIFASIFASFSVENIRQDSIDKEIINEAVITLGDEIESNIEYTKEHLKQVENMLYLTNELLNRYDKIKLTNLYEIHSNNPFIYNIINNGELEYIKKYNDQYNIMSYWNAWEPEDVFFQSMLYSGKLLEIKNKKLRKEIESIYTKHEERVSGMTNYTRNNSDKIMSWFEDGKNNFDRDILNEELFNSYKDQELKNLLKFRSDNLAGRVDNLENYLQALNNVVLLISSEYKKLD